MATTIVSNLAIFSDGTGHGNQNHLVYAVNQARWWLFSLNTKTATVVNTYVSSSNDLTSATWSAGTSSPAFPSSRALVSTEQRMMGCCAITNGSTDVAHVEVGLNIASVNGYNEHIRATFTGASSITWESWNEVTSGIPAGGWNSIIGPSLGVSTTSKFIHGGSLTYDNSMDALARKSTNADSGATWTNGFAAAVIIDSSTTNEVRAYAFAPLASDVMLVVYDGGQSANPNNTGLGWIKSGATGTWSAGSSLSLTGNSVQSADFNDWCLCAVDNTHVYAFRPSSTTAMSARLFNGSTWGALVNAVPSFSGTSFLAGSGFFAATDGTNLWLFALDSVGNNALYYIKGTSANGTVTWDASWTQLEAAGSTARNYISGNPTVSNNQIGVIYTAVNGSNFDIVLSVLSLAAAAAAFPIVQQAGQEPAMMMWEWAGVY